MARSSVEPDRGIALLLESDADIGSSVVREVQILVQQARGEMVPVQVHVLRSAKTKQVAASLVGTDQRFLK